MQDIDRRVKALLDSAQRARAYENALNTVKQQIHRDENVVCCLYDLVRE